MRNTQLLASDPHQCSTSQRNQIFSSGLAAHFGSYVLKPIRTLVIFSTTLNINRHMTHSIEFAKLEPYLSVLKQFPGVSVCRQSSQFLGPVNTPQQSNKMSTDAANPIYGPFFGVMGAASAIIFSGTYLCKSLQQKWLSWMIIDLPKMNSDVQLLMHETYGICCN